MLTRPRVPLRIAFTSKGNPSVIAAVLWSFLMVAVSSTADAATTLVVDDDGFAAVNDCDAATATFMSISTAVAAASPGDTIQVCPGTYVENIPLAKKLTLEGAQAGVDARGRVASESQVTPLVAATPTLTLFTGSAGSIIDGFTFLAGTRAIVSDTGPIDGLQIRNNRIQGFTGNGLFLDDNGINITISKNDIDGTAKLGAGDLVHLDQDNFDGLWFTDNRVANGLTATGFFVDGTRNVDQGAAGSRKPEFTGNLIERNLTGVNLGRLAWGDGPISGNIIRHNLSDGLQGGPKNSTIEDNWFHNNGRNGLGLTSFGNTT